MPADPSPTAPPEPTEADRRAAVDAMCDKEERAYPHVVDWVHRGGEAAWQDGRKVLDVALAIATERARADEAERALSSQLSKLLADANERLATERERAERAIARSELFSDRDGANHTAHETAEFLDSEGDRANMSTGEALHDAADVVRAMAARLAAERAARERAERDARGAASIGTTLEAHYKQRAEQAEADAADGWRTATQEHDDASNEHARAAYMMEQRDSARFLAAGWHRLARQKSDHVESLITDWHRADDVRETQAAELATERARREAAERVAEAAWACWHDSSVTPWSDLDAALDAWKVARSAMPAASWDGDRCQWTASTGIKCGNPTMMGETVCAGHAKPYDQRRHAKGAPMPTDSDKQAASGAGERVKLRCTWCGGSAQHVEPARCCSCGTPVAPPATEGEAKVRAVVYSLVVTGKEGDGGVTLVGDMGESAAPRYLCVEVPVAYVGSLAEALLAASATAMKPATKDSPDAR